MGGGILWFDPADDQSLTIEQCTFMHVSILAARIGTQRAKIPLSFRMDRSLLCAISCCNPIVTLLDVPVSKTEPSQEGFHDALRQTFREFQARDNIASFWDGWWAAVSDTAEPAPVAGPRAVFADLPQTDDTMPGHLRGMIARAWSFVWQENDYAGAAKALGMALPEDLLVGSTGLLEERRKAGVRYGCDITQLPVPPPATLEPIPDGPVPTLASPRTGK